MKTIKLLVAAASLSSAGLYTTAVNADHTLGKYHWDISSAEAMVSPLELGDNLSDDWTFSLTIASHAWNDAILLSDETPDPVLRNIIASAGSDASCSPSSGRVEVCNDYYGENGWLGIASLWATRGKQNHITQANVKLNDTYFNQGDPGYGYNTDEWRDFVMCQEVGHTFGLGHQDEAFTNTNLGTCMDYTNDPDGSVADQLSNLLPNEHDYQLLRDIYAHLNSTSTGGGGGGGGNNKGRGRGKKSNQSPTDGLNSNGSSAWGQAVRQDALGRNSVFERILSNGQILITHVLWTMEEEAHEH